MGVSTTYTGDTIAAGAPRAYSNDGRVITWTFSASGWGLNSQRKIVNNPVSGMADFFGEATSISGDGNVLAVGARLAGGSSSGVAGPGRVYIYLWDGSNWQLADTLHGDSNNDQFGTTVELSASGSVLVVGAPFKDVGSNARAGMVRGA